MQWLVIGLTVGGGAAGIVWAASGSGVFAQKNWLALLAPIGGLAAAATVLARGASLASVARTVDRRADLKERLATALELAAAGDRSVFGEQVHSQAVSDSQRQRMRLVRFWRRTRATAGALGLALAAMMLMLPWATLESDATRQRRQWAALIVGLVLLAALVRLAWVYLPHSLLAKSARVLSGTWSRLQALRKPALPGRLNPGSSAGE